MALIGDREREQAAGRLTEHYLRGRLSLEELTERLEVALTARRHSEVRRALVELPPPWLEHVTEARSGLGTLLLGTLWQRVRRAAFVFAVWTLWWVASLALLVGFVFSVIARGPTLTNLVAFPAFWLVCTVAARRTTRRA
jgi:hypothetical protein